MEDQVTKMLNAIAKGRALSDRFDETPKPKKQIWEDPDPPPVVKAFKQAEEEIPTPSTAPRNLTVTKAKQIADAILQIETKGDYNVIGGSGETGGYQFLPSTWKEWSAKYSPTGKPLPQTKENQDMVAIDKIQEWLDKGHSPEQIASLWNSGSAKWQGKRGINKHGIRYDVPAYVEKFKKEFYKD